MTDSLDTVDLERLRRLRGRFLEAGSASGGPLTDYWRDDADLAAYEAVFAERIGWKWDAVLDELEQRGVSLDIDGPLVDFGCGTGIAARRVGARPALSLASKRIVLHDRSIRARDFAARRVRAALPDHQVESVADCRELRPGLLLISHVLDELHDSARGELLELVRRSAAVVWVEAGTQRVGRELAAIRDELLGDASLGCQVLAPCTHRQACPTLRDLGDGREHWCHFFATPPPYVFTDPAWVRVGRTLGIDLRALPYGFLALRMARDGRASEPDGASAAARLIGRPRTGAKLTRVWICDDQGLRERDVFKSRERELHRDLKKRGAELRLLD